ncbi:MAG: glycosyl hydrolase family 18 protein [Chitinophagales bacterium]
MKSVYVFLLIIFYFSLFPALGQPSPGKPDFRIVGYYSIKSAMRDDPATVPLNKLTHVNLYFLNPDTLGNFEQDYSALIPFIQAAHAQKVKVLASIGGGGAHPYYAALLKEPTRTRFIQDLLSITRQYNLDGIDVDLEGSDIGPDYENFVADLAGKLKANKKLITSAIAVFYKDQLSDRALAQYDFMNVMSYDHTGPWMPEKPGPHSTFQQASDDLDYFGMERKIPKNKLVLGVPFYGYGFGPLPASPATSMNYKEIVNTFPGADSADQVGMPGGATMYYNGISTIKKKTALAKEKASGIMIWQISGDAPAPASLLDALYQVGYEKE